MPASSSLAAVTRGQWQHYLTQFGGLEQQLIGDINSTEMVGQARQSAARQVEAGAGSLDRTVSRFGLGNAPGAVQAQLKRQQQLGAASDTAQAVNTAKIDQRDRNLGMASQLMQLGRGVASQGVSGMSDVAGMEAQRKAQNDQAKAQQRAQTTSTVASVAMIAAMMM